MSESNVAEKLRSIAPCVRDLDRLDQPVWSGVNARWERYVNEEVRNLWDHLSEEAKLVAYFQAKDQWMAGIDLADER